MINSPDIYSVNLCLNIVELFVWLIYHCTLVLIEVKWTIIMMIKSELTLCFAVFFLLLSTFSCFPRTPDIRLACASQPAEYMHTTTHARSWIWKLSTPGGENLTAMYDFSSYICNKCVVMWNSAPEQLLQHHHIDKQHTEKPLSSVITLIVIV